MNVLLNLKNRSFSTTPFAKIGFIGLGNMGRHMAKNLLSKSNNPHIQLSIFDTSPACMDSFVSHFANAPKSLSRPIIARSVEELGKTSQLVLTMLPNNESVMQVHQKLLTSMESGSLVVDSSTIAPDVAANLADNAAIQNIQFLDAPVSGGINGADKASLTFMVGGDKDVLEKATPLLELMGSQVIHCGVKPGSGQIAKLCNNLLLGISMTGLCEVMALGKKLGIDLHLLSRIINSSSGRCWSSEVYNPVPGIMNAVPSENDYEGGFRVPLMRKDLSYAAKAAAHIPLHLPMTEAVLDIYEELEGNEKYNGKDFSVYFKALDNGNNK